MDHRLPGDANSQSDEANTICAGLLQSAAESAAVPGSGLSAMAAEALSMFAHAFASERIKSEDWLNVQLDIESAVGLSGTLNSLVNLAISSPDIPGSITARFAAAASLAEIEMQVLRHVARMSGEAEARTPGPPSFSLN